MQEHLAGIVAAGFALILVADLIGNYITFTHRIYNALVTSIIWGILFTLLNFLYDKLTDIPLLTWELDHFWLWGALGVVLAFLADLVGNTLAFKSRYRNAIITAFVWAVAFYGVSLYLSCSSETGCVWF